MRRNLVNHFDICAMVLMGPIKVQPIGYVKNCLDRRSYNQYKGTESEIIISEEYQDALYRLDDFNYIQVIFYLHEFTSPFLTRTYPTGNPDLPLIGAFSTRTPNRPSRIALTLCKLLLIQDNVLKVRELDAYDGSPVLDIKPYFGARACFDDIRVPKWVDELSSQSSQENR
jgi:tRNA-Thr(GGU) m(6)t(6)A37 methyltransferase TsaA